LQRRLDSVTRNESDFAHGSITVEAISLLRGLAKGEPLEIQTLIARATGSAQG
jgi:hypothetical protein